MKLTGVLPVSCLGSGEPSAARPRIGFASMSLLS